VHKEEIHNKSSASNCHQGDHMKKDKTGGECDTQVGGDNAIERLGGNA
jgi:hypothetical protein